MHVYHNNYNVCVITSDNAEDKCYRGKQATVLQYTPLTPKEQGSDRDDAGGFLEETSTAGKGSR